MTRKDFDSSPDKFKVLLNGKQVVTIEKQTEDLIWLTVKNNPDSVCFVELVRSGLNVRNYSLFHQAFVLHIKWKNIKKI